MPIGGALAFGLVIGWVTYRTLRRTTETTTLADLAAVIAAVGGAAVTTLFDNDQLFGAYSIGLTLGFFLYLAIAVKVDGWEGTSSWMGSRN